MQFIGNDYVSILRRSEVSDTQGGRAVTWVDLVTGHATVYSRFSADVRVLSASERVQAAAVSATRTYEVVVNYRADVTETMRVLWRPYKATTTKTLEIHAVLYENRSRHDSPGAARDYLFLSCGEVI